MDSVKERLFEKRIEVFMHYANNFGISSIDKNIAFRNLDDSLLRTDKVKVDDWFLWQIRNNYEGFRISISEYKDIYPFAYEKIIGKLNCDNKPHSRIIVLLSYLERDGALVPSGRDAIRFCDMDSSFDDEAIVGIWIQYMVLRNNIDRFVSMYSVYRDLYPVGCEKLDYRVSKRDDNLFNRKRLSMVISYLVDYDLQLSDRFCDICNINSKVNVKEWLGKQVNSNFFDIVKDICEEQGLDYQDILRKITNGVTNNRKCLSREKMRERAFVKYLEDNNFPIGKDKLTFKDIDKDIDDGKIVYNWFVYTYRVHGDRFIRDFDEYKDMFPKGYDKIMKRVGIYQHRSETLGTSREDKVRVYMTYLENNKFIGTKMTFADLDMGLNIDSVVSLWISNEMAYSLDKFIMEVNRYRDIYPYAYDIVCSIINGNDARVRRERLLLLDKLKMVRDNVLEKESFSKVKKM